MCGRFEVKDPFEKTIMLFHCVVVFATFLAVNAAALGKNNAFFSVSSISQTLLITCTIIITRNMVIVFKCMATYSEAAISLTFIFAALPEESYS